MPEAEFEEVAEVAHDVLREHASEAETPDWVKWTAVSAMLMALFSAVGALLAGITANEALLTRTEEIVEVVERNRDQLEIEILISRQEVLEALGQTASEDARIDEISREMERLKEEASEVELKAQKAMHDHEVFAIGVTLLSIAITLSGMAVVSRRPRVWHVGLAIGAVGSLIVGYGVLQMFSI